MVTRRSRATMGSISPNTLDNVVNFRDVGKNVNEFTGKKLEDFTYIVVKCSTHLTSIPDF